MYDQYGKDGVNGSSPRSGHRQRGHRHRHQEEFEGFEDFDGFFGFPNFVFRYCDNTYSMDASIIKFFQFRLRIKRNQLP